jgi:hypothetical protein
VESTGLAGEYLRRVLAEQRPEQRVPRFVTLRERRLQRVRRGRALGVAAVALSMLLGLRMLQENQESPGIRAEPPVRPTDPQSAPIHPQGPAAAPPPRALPSQPAVSTELTPRSKLRTAPPRLAGEQSQRSPEHGAQAPQTKDTEVGGGAKACAQLARDGTTELALACYDKLASGSGIMAELALFEQARLEGKMLRSPERALRTLNSYRQRFQHGSLRAEVMLAQIDWLLASGQRAPALALVDEALGSGLLSERKAELERLRATLASELVPPRPAP